MAQVFPPYNLNLSHLLLLLAPRYPLSDLTVTLLGSVDPQLVTKGFNFSCSRSAGIYVTPDSVTSTCISRIAGILLRLYIYALPRLLSSIRKS